MAKNKETHIVEIAVDNNEHQHNLLSTIQHHPLSEISQSPGHFLLLKLWQREEHLHGRILARKEARMDSIRREIFQLLCFFFLFHGLVFTLLFSSSSSSGHDRCDSWWIPSILSGCISAVIAFLVHTKLWRYWKVDRQLQRERVEGRALARCIQELRMKGVSFDLCKGPQNGKRLKSSSVEIKWKPVSWCLHYRASVFLVCFAGLALPCCRFLLCA